MYRNNKIIALSTLCIGSELNSTYELELASDRFTITLFTSGSTGEPKGVMFNHDATLFNLRCWKSALNLSEKSRLFTEQGCLLILASYIFGGELILPKSQMSETDSERYLGIFNKYLPDTCFMMPSGYEKIAIELSDEEHSAFGKVRTLLTGGAPLSDGALSVIGRCNSSSIRSGYGLTEVPLISFSDEFQQTSDKKCVGWPFDGVQVQVKSSSYGEVGEILVSSPGQSSCYMISGNKELIPERPFETGDLGYLDISGKLYIVGRNSQCVRNSEQKYIGIGEIESELETIAHSRACAFITGKERPRGLRKWCVVISNLNENGRLGHEREKDILEFITVNFPTLERQAEIYYTEEALPFNTAGKVDRLSLAKTYNIE